MIYFYWGENRDQIIREVMARIAKEKKANSTSEIVEVVVSETSIDRFQEIVYDQSLFGGPSIVSIDSFSDNPEIRQFVSDNLTFLVGDKNIFVVRGGKEEDDLAQEIKKSGGQVEFFGPSSSKKVDRLDPSLKLFAVADAFGNRDRKRAWLLFHEILQFGLPAEEIFWKFVWKIKTLLLVSTASPGSNLPLKPYPLAQAKRQLGRYEGKEELQKLSSRLIAVYHDSRFGGQELSLALERLILEL